MKKSFKNIAIESLPAVAEYLKQMVDSNTNIFLFQGNLGAGKTSLIKSFGDQLAVLDSIHSPTYALVNTYEDRRGNKIHHFDLYRLESEEELDGMGFEEYLTSGEICLIEWPEIAHHILEDYTYALIQIAGEGDQRDIEIRI